MPWRFRKRVRIAPGLNLNLSKRGASLSVGGRGVTANLKRGRKTKVTTSLRGTGLSRSTSCIVPVALVVLLVASLLAR